MHTVRLEVAEQLMNSDVRERLVILMELEVCLSCTGQKQGAEAVGRSGRTDVLDRTGHWKAVEAVGIHCAMPTITSFCHKKNKRPFLSQVLLALPNLAIDPSARPSAQPAHILPHLKGLSGMALVFCSRPSASSSFRLLGSG